MKRVLIVLVCLLFSGAALAQDACSDGPGFSDGVWFQNPNPGDCQCICSYDLTGTHIEIFGLGPGDPPNISVEYGCDEYPDCIHPTGYEYDETDWLYTDGGTWNSWSNPSFSNIGDGCFTICYEGRGDDEPCESAPITIDPSQGAPQYFCVDVCEGGIVGSIAVGPGLTDQTPPIVSFLSGCATPTGCEDPNCTPSLGEIPEGFNGPEWFWGFDGYWYADYQPVAGAGNGCTCLCFEGILPVELISFDAIPGDRSILLSWSTASETEHDHFKIERDNTMLAVIDAENSASGATYSWTEIGLTNGASYSYNLIAVDVNGIHEHLGTTSATPSLNNATVSEYALHQNYPNPFNPKTSIRFDLIESGNVTLTIANALGQTVATLVNGILNAGSHTVTFEALDLPSGIYFYRLTANDFAAVRKMVLMK